MCFDPLVGDTRFCEPMMCTPELQRYTRDTTSESFVCDRCSEVPDGALSVVHTRYESSDLTLDLVFDYRVGLDVSLENLTKYALHASGEYHNQQGNSRFFGVPFEVLAYDGHKLHLRIQADMFELSFVTSGAPHFCPIGGVPVPCTNTVCAYGVDIGDPDATAQADSFQLVIDLNLPLTITPY